MIRILTAGASSERMECATSTACYMLPLFANGRVVKNCFSYFRKIISPPKRLLLEPFRVISLFVSIAVLSEEIDHVAAHLLL